MPKKSATGDNYLCWTGVYITLLGQYKEDTPADKEVAYPEVILDLAKNVSSGIERALVEVWLVNSEGGNTRVWEYIHLCICGEVNRGDVETTNTN